MRIPNHSKRRPIQFNMTPMIDVVFLLIIFFLVSSHLAKQETQLELALPTAQSGETPSETNRPRVTINVAADGRVMLGGSPVGPKELQQRLLYEKNRSGNDLEVRIRSDRTVPYRVVSPILFACAKSGIWNVTFAVFEKGT